MIELGHFSDRRIPSNLENIPNDRELYKLNSHGYRCPEWSPMPDGKKNVVVLGCSHTFGQGNAEDEHWVHFLSQHNTNRLRYWNLGQPGSSADKIVRTLYGSEQILEPRVVIVCWPAWSRREILKDNTTNATADHEELAKHDDERDKHNFLMNVFYVEKYADKNNAKTFHCFAQDPYHEEIKRFNVLEDYSISNCWPYWHKVQNRVPEAQPSLARDGLHFGIEHHERFAGLFLEKFGSKLN